jgi:hypothetical protein
MLEFGCKGTKNNDTNQRKSGFSLKKYAGAEAPAS